MSLPTILSTQVLYFFTLIMLSNHLTILYIHVLVYPEMKIQVKFILMPKYLFFP